MTLNVENLPNVMPIFPLMGTILLPGGQLPLRIFEERYKVMIRAAYDGTGLIGTLQPNGATSGWGSGFPEILPIDQLLYNVGCACVITEYEEIDGGDIMVLLTGICRFDVTEEITPRQEYRQMMVDYHRFSFDGRAQGRSPEILRADLIDVMQKYLKIHGISTHWKKFEELDDEDLINNLAMICPLTPSEKQALIEQIDLKDRMDLMTSMMKLALAGNIHHDLHNIH